VEAFGGKVTGAVSGRTHILVVGKDPGLGKYSQAQSQPNCQIMVRCMHKAFSCITIVTHSAQYLEDLRAALQAGQDVLAPKERPVMITNFSSGYMGNGLAGRLKNYADAESKPAAVKRILEAQGAPTKQPRQKKARKADLD